MLLVILFVILCVCLCMSSSVAALMTQLGRTAMIPTPTVAAEEGCTPDYRVIGTEAEHRVLAGLQDDTAQFVALLQRVRPDVAETLRHRFTGKIILIKTGTGGRYIGNLRCIGMEVAGLSQERLRTKLVHEIAHAAAGVGAGHGPVWLTMFTTCMELATTHLGWRLTVDCTGNNSACRYGVCREIEHGACPRCTVIGTGCGTGTSVADDDDE